MKLLVLLFLVFAGEVSAQCFCNTMKWASCDGTPCVCNLLVGNGTNQPLNCSALIPKCYLMQAEMYRRRNHLGTRSSVKPEGAVVDNDGIYDPVCQRNGIFQPKQCNNTEQCWCVNSAGVRRSDKGDMSITCEEAETYWVRLSLTHNPVDAALDAGKLQTGIQNVLQQRYNLSKNLVKDVQYDKDAQHLIVDIKKEKGDRVLDLPRIAYYLEKDIKVAPLFRNASNLQLNVEGKNVTFKDVVIYYVDEKPPNFTMKRLTGGVVALIVVVLLAIIGGLAFLYFIRKREQEMSNKSHGQQMDDVQK